MKWLCDMSYFIKLKLISSFVNSMECSFVAAVKLLFKSYCSLLVSKVKFDLWRFSWRFQSTHIPLRQFSRLKTLRFLSKIAHGYFNGSYSTTPIWIEIVTISIVISIISGIWVDRNRHENRHKSNFTFRHVIALRLFESFICRFEVDYLEISLLSA